jgi:hypothetical protein
LNLLFLNRIIFTSFCLQPSELNNMFSLVKNTCSPDFIIGTIGGRLIHSYIRKDLEGRGRDLIEVQSRNFPGRTEENHGNLQSE